MLNCINPLLSFYVYNIDQHIINTNSNRKKFYKILLFKIKYFNTYIKI